MLNLTDRQQKLLDFVKLQHGSQLRKYTNEPYWHHLVSVAEIVSEYEPNGIEIALCHDLLEDTECTKEMLFDSLCSAGYDKDFSKNIVFAVIDLTDVFTHECYPRLNRKERKLLELKKLRTISTISQSVKYADLIDNSSSIVEHDKGFAKVYLQEKQEILSVMRAGNPGLLKRCEQVLEESLMKLKED